MKLLLSIRTILFLTLLFCTNSLLSQSLRSAWGVVPKEDLAMQFCPIDSTAPAFILSDYCESFMNNDFTIELFLHRRIKIFNRAGFKYAFVSMNISQGQEEEQLSDIKANTYYLNDQNEMETVPLQSEDIYRKKTSAVSEMCSFTFPALKPGCIIEYTMKFTTPDLRKGQKWTFQEGIPVRWSEFIVKYPSELGYEKIVRGAEKIDVVSHRDTILDISGKMQYWFGGHRSRFNIYSWAVKNKSAIKEEPFSNNIKNYALAVELQIRRFSSQFFNQKLLSNWAEVGALIGDINKFEEYRVICSEVKNLAMQITKDLTTPAEKMAAIHDWVKNNIQTNGLPIIFRSSSDFNELLKEKRGNITDANLLLIALLRSVDIACNPVITSVRSLGKIQDIYPAPDQFNYLFVWAKIDNEYIGMDASSALMPRNLIPPDVLNTLGLVIKDENTEWIEIIAPRKDSIKQTATCTIAADGSLEGQISCTVTDYSALQFREVLKSQSEKEIIRRAFNITESEFEPDSIEFFYKDQHNHSLKMAAHIQASSFLQKSENTVFFSPFIIDKITASPFTDSVRLSGLDFGYPAINFVSLDFTIPEGYIVSEAPTSCTFYSKESGVVYGRKVTFNERKIHVERKFEIKTSLQPREMYESVRTFYEKVLKAETEQIVLSKINTTQLIPEKTIEQTPVPTKEKKKEKSK